MQVVAKPGDLIVLVSEDREGLSDAQRAGLPDDVGVLVIDESTQVQQYSVQPDDLFVLTFANNGYLTPDRTKRIAALFREQAGDVGVLIRVGDTPEIDRFTAEEMDRAGWVRKEALERRERERNTWLTWAGERLGIGPGLSDSNLRRRLDETAKVLTEWAKDASRRLSRSDNLTNDGGDHAHAIALLPLLPPRATVPAWYPLLRLVEPKWHTGGEAGHTAALAFLASVYDGDEPERWTVCVDDETVLRVEWQGPGAESLGAIGAVRDAAVVPPLADIPSLTVWGDSSDVPLFSWAPG